ncbi:MAG: Lrp/AsnC family transcriptional regulator [Acutalibacteraceae bacterium]
MMDELLSLIKENPRLTNAELAAALDRDEAQVAQQVRQYEADGVIKGYCAILDKEKAGDETVTALIEIKVQPKFGHGFDDIARRIAALEEVESIFLMSGGYDLCCLVTDSPSRRYPCSLPAACRPWKMWCLPPPTLS